MEATYQQLIKNDGVHPDILTNQDKFQNCQVCQTPFTLSFLPILLSCGHFICSTCRSNQVSKCYICSLDGIEMTIKMSGYKSFFVKSVDTKKEETYIFRVAHNEESKMGGCEHVTLNMTPFQIIKKFNNVMGYLDKISGNVNKLIQINSKTYNLMDIKDTPLKDIKSKNGVPLLIKSGVVNLILLYDRSKGGRADDQIRYMMKVY